MALPRDKAFSASGDGEERASVQSPSAEKEVQEPKERPKTAAEKREEEDRKQRRKVIAIVIAAVILVLVIAGVIVGTLWGAGGDDDEAEEEETTSQEGSGPLVDDGESVLGDGVGFDVPVEAEGYLLADRSAMDQGLEDYQEDYEEDFELPEDAVGDTSQQDPDDLEDYTGHSYEVSEIDPNDVDYETSDVRYLIEYYQEEIDEVAAAAQSFPSRQAGYTNNPDFYELEDGEYNPMYSYVLAEDVKFAFGHHVERLLNPVYGGWWQYQLGEDDPARELNTGEFSDMFTSGWWERNVTDIDGEPRLPILADWNADDYGGMDLIEGSPRWFGEVTSYDIDVDGEEIKAVLDVTYTSYASDGETTRSVDGVLELTFVPNEDNPDDINHRLVISSSSLSIND